MTPEIHIILALLCFLCFFLASINVPTRANLVAMGLLFLSLALLLPL